MGGWIAVVVILMLIGTVSWAMPSPRDRLLAAMRTQALRLGIRVRLVDKTLAEALFPWLEYFHDYVLYEKDLLLENKNTSRDIKVFKLPLVEETDATKDSCNDSIDLLRVMGGCGSFTRLISAVVVSSRSLSFLWKEQGSIEDVIQLDRCLEQLNHNDEFWQLVTS